MKSPAIDINVHKTQPSFTIFTINFTIV